VDADKLPAAVNITASGGRSEFAYEWVEPAGVCAVSVKNLLGAGAGFGVDWRRRWEFFREERFQLRFGSPRRFL
jgi:hypothetical protein